MKRDVRRINLEFPVSFLFILIEAEEPVNWNNQENKYPIFKCNFDWVIAMLWLIVHYSIKNDILVVKEIASVCLVRNSR